MAYLGHVVSRTKDQTHRTHYPTMLLIYYKAGIRRTTFPSFRAWMASLSRTFELAQRSGGALFPVDQ